MKLSKLLAGGYFPKELPPNFESTSFSQAVSGGDAPTSQRRRPCETLPHSLARAGGVRRVLGIPNPWAQTLLSEEISREWDTLRKHIRSSPLSVSWPTLVGTRGRALVPRTALADVMLVRARTRSAGRVLVRADIAEYYNSVYTHSIAWALHGKAAAKKNRSRTLLGNRLDACVRKGQHDQTNGIPIGPDTSLVIGEVVLSAVDRKVCSRIEVKNGFRFFDDYELVFRTLGDAEQALAILQETLMDYGLRLHATKTRIVDLPDVLEEQWVLELRDFSLKKQGANEVQRLARFFDRVFRLQQRFPQEPVIAYGIGRIEHRSLDGESWELAQDLMFQCALAYPSAVPQVIRAIAQADVDGRPIRRDKLEEVLNHIVSDHAQLGHSSEVVWGLWGLLAFKLSGSSETASTIARVEDSLVALLALDASRCGVLPRNLDTSTWEQMMVSEGLYSAQCLLAYEALQRRWLDPADGRDYINSDAFFKFLKDRGVHFYKQVSAPTRATVVALESRKGSYGGKAELAESGDE